MSTAPAYWHARAADWRARAARAGEDASLPGIGALGRALARRRAREAAAMAAVLDGLAAQSCPAGKDSSLGGH